MKNRIDEYEIELINKIFDLGGWESPDIWSRWHNKLSSLWCRNYKDLIKVETLMEIPIEYYGEKKYEANFRFDITPEQAKEIIKVLQKTLNNRKK